MSTTTARPSRAPFYVTAGFFAIAVTLVLIGLRGSPPLAVVIDRPGTPDAPREIPVIMRDYLFEPDPLVLVRGETVRFVVFDGGLDAHEFVLGDAAVQSAWASAHAAATTGPLATPPPASVPAGVGGLRILVVSGQQATADFLVPEDSELELMCHLPGHVAQGMVGRVEIRPELGGASPSPSVSR